MATTKPIWFDQKTVNKILQGDSRLKARDILIARKSDIDAIKQALKDAYVLSEATTRAIASVFAYITVPKPTPPPPGPPGQNWLGRKITLPGYNPMSRSRR